MSLAARIASFVLECGVACAAAGLVLGLVIPLTRYLGWTLGPPWNVVLIFGILLGLVAGATLRPGGSLRPRK